MFSLVICAGLLVLLVAAIGKKNREHCSDLAITIRGVQNNFFLDQKDVLSIISTATGGKIKGQTISTINLRKLEQLLEKNTWIQDAELYFDNQDVLHVIVYEREPIARVFALDGKSFYLDSSAYVIPLSDKKTADVPVFTSFPTTRNMSDKDSVLLKDIRNISQYIISHDFWMSQVEQVDITPARNFEMVPTIGNHVVKLGDGNDIAQKFHRLFVFYKDVMSKTGFEKYSIVDVQFAGQVIGSRSQLAKVDSVQLRKNVEQLLRESQEMQQDSLPQQINQTTEKPLIHLEQQAAPQTTVVRRVQ